MHADAVTAVSAASSARGRAPTRGQHVGDEHRPQLVRVAQLVAAAMHPGVQHPVGAPPKRGANGAEVDVGGRGRVWEADGAQLRTPPSPLAPTTAQRARCS